MVYELEDHIYSLENIRKSERKHNLEYPDGFWTWLDENEHIYQAFQKIAHKERFENGRLNFSARAIIDKLRWDTPIKEINSQFKLSNEMGTGLSRLCMAEYPELKGFFRIRDSLGNDK